MDAERLKQIDRDTYYMHLAEAVETGASCLGTQVGALIVLKDRAVSTGYNGTPTGFPNCTDHGCVRCHDGWLYKQGRQDEMSDPNHVSGAALDRCICVHAEQNAFLTAARFGIGLDGATLYTTVSPCFGCLKEAVQVGIARIVYQRWYGASYGPALVEQYVDLYARLSGDDPTAFEALGGGRPEIEPEGQPDPYAEHGARTVRLDPPPPTSN
jgi:dCMP deaminase